MAIDTRSIPRTAYVVPADPIWRLSVEQYHEMIRTGILTDDDPVELLEGWLVTKMPKNPPHRLATQLARELIDRLLPPGWYVDAQEPITTASSEPEPDVLVVRGERRQYSDRHPRADEVALVIEVSDTTLQRDRTLKKAIYAREGIPIYWIVNLSEAQIEVYTAPSGPAEQPDYQQRQDYRLDEQVPLLLDGQQFAHITARDVLL